MSAEKLIKGYLFLNSKIILACPGCNATTQHFTFQILTSVSGDGSNVVIKVPGESSACLFLSECVVCHNHMLWMTPWQKDIEYIGLAQLIQRDGTRLLMPSTNPSVPPPSSDMPEEVRKDFSEACKVLEASPRSAAALLRLALQKLMSHLGKQGKNINEDIAALVKAGLSVRIQQALDCVRVIGNEAVHPGELDLRDDRETVLQLFNLVNLIIEDRITTPKKIEQMYSKLPQNKREEIEKRDSKK